MHLWACKLGGKTIDVDDDEGVSKCLKSGVLENPDLSPETGTVTDNSDGSYFTGYLITRAGQYKLSIEISGSLGANSPYILTVKTDEADKSLTYVYGALAGIKAGVVSQLYVQTRDRFGNAIRADVNDYPLREVNGGTEDIQFELCKMPVGTSAEKCGGGEEYTSVGVEIRYSIGPDGKETDPLTGEPYWGLYKIEFFPFNAEPVLPRVLHADKDDDGDPATLVKCYFDTTGLAATREAMDPGAEGANACIEEVAQEENLSARRGSWHVQPTLPMLDLGQHVPTDENLRSKGWLSSESSRRAPKAKKQSELLVTIEATFDPPNTDLLIRWLALGPVICAVIAAVFACLNGVSTSTFVE